MIITIDGPGASGKSVIAQRLAERLQDGYRCLNTGAMYRAVGMIALTECPDLADDCVAAVAGRTRLDFDWEATPPTLLVDGRRLESERELLSEGVANAASQVARVPGVREVLIAQQVRIGRSKPNLVSEGRDQGSVVFPDAPVKFFLTADVRTRARRRLAQLIRKGKAGRDDEASVTRDLERRDHQDMTSDVGRLIVPDDAQVIDSTHIHTVDEVAEAMLTIIRVRPAARAQPAPQV